MKVLLVVATLICVGQYVADAARTMNRREEGMPPMIAEDGDPLDEEKLMMLSRCAEFCEYNDDSEMCMMFMRYIQSDNDALWEEAMQICEFSLLPEIPGETQEMMLGRCDEFCGQERNAELDLCVMYREYQLANMPPDEVLEVCKRILQE